MTPGSPGTNRFCPRSFGGWERNGGTAQTNPRTVGFAPRVCGESVLRDGRRGGVEF